MSLSCSAWLPALLVVFATSVAGCSGARVQLSPERVSVSQSADAELTLHTSDRAPHLVAGQGGVRLRASVRVLIGDHVAEILRADARSVTVRAGATLALGMHAVVLEVGGTRYVADPSLEVYDGLPDGGVDQAVGDLGGDVGLADSGGSDSSVDQAMDVGLDVGVTGLSPCDTDDTTLLACYRFEGDTQDGSSYARHATSNLNAYNPGRDGLAGNFAQMTSFVTTDTTGIAGTTAHTVAAWVLPAEDRSASLVGYGMGYVLRIESTGGLFARVHCEAPGADAVGYAFAVPSSYYHVACVFDATSVTVYVSGLRLQSRPRTTGAFPTSPIYVGGGPPPDDAQFRGRIDDIRMWSRALTSTEICAASSSRFCN